MFRLGTIWRATFPEHRLKWFESNPNAWPTSCGSPKHPVGGRRSLRLYLIKERHKLPKFTKPLKRALLYSLLENLWAPLRSIGHLTTTVCKFLRNFSEMKSRRRQLTGQIKEHQPKASSYHFSRFDWSSNRSTFTWKQTILLFLLICPSEELNLAFKEIGGFDSVATPFEHFERVWKCELESLIPNHNFWCQFLMSIFVYNYAGIRESLTAQDLPRWSQNFWFKRSRRKVIEIQSISEVLPSIISTWYRQNSKNFFAVWFIKMNFILDSNAKESKRVIE